MPRRSDWAAAPMLGAGARRSALLGSDAGTAVEIASAMLVLENFAYFALEQLAWPGVDPRPWDMVPPANLGNARARHKCLGQDPRPDFLAPLAASPGY